VQDACARGAECILFAGDLFRGHKPTPTELCLARDALRLAENAIYGIPGNHDLPRCVSEVNALMPLRGVALDVRNAPSVIDMSGQLGRLPFQLATLPYPNRAQLAAGIPEFAGMTPEEADQAVAGHLTTILRGLAAALNPGIPSVLLAHIPIDLAEPGAERGIMAGRDICVPLDEIPEEFSFCVLGHVHYAQDFAKYGRPNVLYCGSTDRIDWGEEGQEKSYVILDTEAGTWERVTIPCREWRTMHLEVADVRGVTCVTAPDDSNPPASLRDAICRIKLTRPEHFHPNYDMLRQTVEDAGCYDFRGFIEEVHRTAAIRSEEITKAQSLEELLGVWHAAKGCDVPLGDLVAVAVGMEGTVR
jgi:DNA repair exonuclease SbcCD nuclease subunit